MFYTRLHQIRIRSFFIALLMPIALISFALFVSQSPATLAQTTTDDHPLYLPLLTRPPEIESLQFGYAASCGDNPSNYRDAPVTMPSGIRRLGLALQIAGAKDSELKLEWYYNGDPQTGLTLTRPINSDSYTLPPYSIHFGFAGFCGNAIPAGEWEVRVYIDDVLTGSGVATTVGGRDSSAETGSPGVIIEE